MKRILRTFQINHQKFWSGEKSLKSVFLALGLFILALLAQHFANNYVGRVKGTPVSDVLLNLLPTIDIDFFIVESALALTFAALCLVIYKPKYLAFGLKTFALFILVRSFFITLTHLGASPNQIIFDPNDFGFKLYSFLYNSSNDFFFSGHTGIPFLLALVFWPEKPWRYLFLTASALFGAFVLFAHLHYSIDVFAAPFITYSIYILATKIFPKGYAQSLEK